MGVRFTDRDGATWEMSSPTEARCLNEPDAYSDDWEPDAGLDDWVPGVPVRLADIARSYGPLDFAEAVDNA
jgi:hypothetical protein